MLEKRLNFIAGNFVLISPVLKELQSFLHVQKNKNKIGDTSAMLINKLSAEVLKSVRKLSIFKNYGFDNTH
jgi:hypothetical protein